MQQGAGESFSRLCRLTRADDYRQVFEKNQRLSDDCLTLLVGKQRGEQPRIGFAVAKKQVRRAVDRNRLKRLMRESFRHHQHELPAVDIVVMVRSRILQLDNSQIFSRLENHWQKIIKRCATC